MKRDNFVSCMIELVKNNLRSIQLLCEKYHVAQLSLIGSALSSKAFNEKSDIDLLLKFNKEHIPEIDYADNYFTLLFELQKVFQRKVDLISEEKLSNPYFIASVEATRQTLYESGNKKISL